jgi:hypothetical protein
MKLAISSSTCVGIHSRTVLKTSRRLGSILRFLLPQKRAEVSRRYYMHSIRHTMGNIGAKKAMEMSVGQIGIVTSGSFKGVYLLRTAYHFIDLANPDYTWGYPTFDVQVLPKGANIVIQVGA